jgi:hypothetical protein
LKDDPFRRLRQCHAIEHATVAVLIERRGGRRLRVAGLSHPGGFVLACRVPAPEVESAAREARRRLEAGELRLALSDQCGTTLVLGGFLTALAARIALRGGGPFSRAVLGAAGALAFSPVLGSEVQRHLTTDAAVGARQVRSAGHLFDTPLGPLTHVAIS